MRKTPPPYVHIRNLGMVFHPASVPVVALDDISLDVAEGEFFSILGPSGCGKSTLMLLVAGLVTPTSGTLLVEGKPLSGAYKNAGIAFQHHNLLEWRTVLDNVLLPLEIRRQKTKPYVERARELLTMVGLESAGRLYPYQLSGGMRQRAALCRALVCNQPLLLMDEPFGALDALTREEHQLMLQDIWLKERKTVVFITHDVREAILLSDRVAVMTTRPGRILEVFDIDLPRPRAQEASETPEFNTYVHRIRAKLYARRVDAAGDEP
jgi:NitT/TauT family transport system ATP-binding protein